MGNKAISFRPDEEAAKIIRQVMQENKLKQSEAIRYLAIFYAKQDSNSNPYYRKLLAKFSMDMEDALNYIERGGSVAEARKVMGELECQIL